MKLSQYGYDFTPETAQYPTINRDDSRLMVINRKTGEFVTAGTYTAPEKYRNLYKHLLNNDDVIAVPYFNQKLLFQTPRDIVRMINANDERWKEYVPEEAYRMAEHLKTHDE